MSEAERIHEGIAYARANAVTNSKATSQCEWRSAPVHNEFYRMHGARVQSKKLASADARSLRAPIPILGRCRVSAISSGKYAKKEKIWETAQPRPASYHAKILYDRKQPISTQKYHSFALDKNFRDIYTGRRKQESFPIPLQRKKDDKLKMVYGSVTTTVTMGYGKEVCILAPQRCYSMVELAKKVQEFIDAVDDGTIDMPDDYRLLKFLGISYDTLQRYMNEKDKYDGYAEALKPLLAYREHFYLKMAKDSKTSAFTIFCLKQPKNGGYTDKETKTIEPVKLEVSINGVKGAFE